MKLVSCRWLRRLLGWGLALSCWCLALVGPARASVTYRVPTSELAASMDSCDVLRQNDPQGTDTDGGNITIRAAEVQIVGDRSRIAADSATGNGGDISIQAERIWLAPRQVGNVTAISATAGKDSTGDGGNVCLLAQSFEAEKGGRVSVVNRGHGNAGDIFVASDRILLANNSSFVALSLGEGSGGDITLRTRIYQAENTGTIVTSSRNRGRAGAVRVRADLVSLKHNSDIRALSVDGASNGFISISTNSLVMQEDSDIATVHNTHNEGSAGDIEIEAYDSVILTGASDISAIARGSGRGGNIAISTRVFARTPNSHLCPLSLGGGTDGRISVSAQIPLGHIESSKNCHL